MALFLQRPNKASLNRIITNTSRYFSNQSKVYPFAARNGLSQELMHGAPCDFVCCETHINELQSPACIINLETVEQNCRTMELISAKHNLNLRAHLKTHKVKHLIDLMIMHKIKFLIYMTYMIYTDIRDC